ncbi:chalcone isomerase family protein [Vreelandella utahensis]|uniref:chalcone isomerase family protein n=1 Tax=Vreelandella halophila TaxID=86177 RepID=UPI0009840B65|nr:chalcone isomerase family protein [Halomonas utahensis]
MKQMLTLAFALLCAFAMTAQAQEKTVEGVELPGTIDVAGNELSLNGAGVRSKWFMSLYVGSLYLPQEFDSAQAIVEADQPMAIQLDIISGMIDSENMTEATMEGFESSTGGNMEPIQDDIDAFMGLFEQEIKEGDQFKITYIPGEGIVGFKNGDRIGTVDGGMDFKKAVFGIWLGDEPAQESVKTAMMGKE